MAGGGISTSARLDQTLREQFSAARARTDELFALLTPEALYLRPVAERHRLIFYLGHIEAFDWNQVCRGALGAPSFHPSFDKLFEFGIDPPPGRAPEDKASDWPSAAEVRAYNQRLRQYFDELAGEAPEQLLYVALEHRLMHAETFAYLLHNLAYEHKLPPAGLVTGGGAGTELLTNPMVRVPAGKATLGQSAGAFGWDNEFEQVRVPVSEFSIARYKITNGEYVRFVNAGAPAPHFWVQRDGEWRFRGMFADSPLPLDAPVYVTYKEASAYARWRGQALPTEPQYHRAAFGTPSGEERPYPWGAAAPAPRHGNFDFRGWDPVPVSADAQGDSAFGISQLAGNGWEWTSTPFAPFAGFREFPFYPGYSRDFFDGQHYVLKGGSPRTAACFLRRSFRNWFRPNYPYVYASFRLVEN